MKEKLSYFTQLHEEDLRNSISKLLQKWYSTIEFKISNSSLKNLDEINAELDNLYENLSESYETPLKNELYKDFSNKVLNFAGEFYFNKFNTEMTIAKNETAQMCEKLTRELNECKNNNDLELKKKNLSIERYKSSLTEKHDQLTSVQEKYSILEKEKEQREKTMKDKFSSIIDERERKYTSLEAKHTTACEKIKELEKVGLMSQSDSEKEKALLEQKLEHYHKQIDDLSKREKESNHELKSQIKEQAVAIKDINSKNEAQVKKLNKTIEELNEKIIELEATISNKNQSLDHEKIKTEENSQLLSSEKEEKQNLIKEYKESIQKLKKSHEDELALKENELNSTITSLKEKLGEAEGKNKSSDENSKNLIKKLQNEYALLKQSNEFLELQIKELNTQNEDQKKYYEKLISTLENKTFSMVGHDEFQKKMEEMKKYYEKDKKFLEESFEKNKIQYLQQVSIL